MRTTQLPAALYKTYGIAAPLTTHWRKATCEEVACEAYKAGWRLRVEGLDPAMLHAATTSGRRYRRLDVAAAEHWLVFDAGQPCFRAPSHRIRMDRPELYIVRGGDLRRDPTSRPYVHSGPDAWVNDFGDNQDRLAAVRERG